MKVVKLFALAGALSLLVLTQPEVQAEPIEYVAQDLNGTEQRLSDFRGKWVLVKFWASWCMPCLAELPELEAFHNKHKESDAVVLGVNMESIELEKLRTFVKEKAVTFPIVQMEPAATTPFGPVYGMPTSYLINPKGEVAARETGVLTAEMIESFIDKYTNDPGSINKKP